MSDAIYITNKAQRYRTAIVERFLNDEEEDLTCFSSFTDTLVDDWNISDK